MATHSQSQGLSQEQVLRQRMRLSPVQLRYGHLLEMSEPELEDEVRTAVEENPALEVVEQPVTESVTSREDDLRQTTRFYNYTSDDERWEPQAQADAPGLAEQLMAQTAELGLTEAQRRIAGYVIGNIDDNGYLTRSAYAMATDIGAVTGDYVETADVDAMVQLVRRRLEPAGVGATDLRDCLLLQLNRHSRAADPDLRLAAAIVADPNLFELLSSRDLRALAEALRRSAGHSEAEVHDAVEAIRTLNPKPGAAMTPPGESERANAVIPDFVVETDTAGRATVHIPNRLPELELARSFSLAEGSPAASRTAVDAMAPFRDEALTLIKALRMRADTMMAVMQAIVRRQKAFFAEEDPSRLRPMLLKDIAADTGLDLSTVSRATSGKYVATSRGVYPLRMFFNEAAPGADTTVHSVLEAISAIIAAEDKAHPLSDDAIAERLGNDGTPLARRTVAKYRERLGLPPARLRRSH